MNQEALTRGEVGDLIAAHHPLKITYRSLLVRQIRDAAQPAGNITVVGFEDLMAKAIQDTLQIPVNVLGALTISTELETNGLYVIKSPDADSAQAILGNQRTGPGAHPVNGIARIVCVEKPQ